ncbi:glycoside hydrolase family 3 N-terminal domain-containing protein [Streptomyces sp. ICBB 8177]|uniref:glycoside hydrolase family 3 N-terminal domain-containing protein n=1 Tax=Streptomyces sp. ICBB 8177 TaxID=563922 RepID=UPI000D67DA8E|nr:glycoside hydrolase family 3 N-terminal domain-containing protein [Streptomyces sp. ICBB 8177]PWI41683.1 beta-N-acetylhexosaminidase [Streptomyces sp. ICBB 8177]
MDAPRTSSLRRRTLLAAAGAAVATASAATGAQRAAAAPLHHPHRPPHRQPELTSRQLAGQRVVYSYPGLTPPAALLDAIRAGEVAGVIFFGENISSDAQITSVIGQLNQANVSGPVRLPLLLMTDQEGGEVRRLPGAPAQSEKQIGEAGDPAGAASTAGTQAGQNLAGVGMNVNLAPVLDVYRTAGNFIDEYQRSYSMDPAVVSSCGHAFIEAQQKTGVAATAKHFPGLGAATTSQNTDEGPVTLTQGLSELRSVDEAPYTAAVCAGVRLVMCSWAVYPALDAGRPAGLSSVVVQRELRQRLGFTGVTITDALEAGAIDPSYDTGTRAVLAATAGMDLLLCSARDASQGADAVTALASALGSGQLPTAAFDAAVERVTALREWVG